MPRPRKPRNTEKKSKRDDISHGVNSDVVSTTFQIQNIRKKIWTKAVVDPVHWGDDDLLDKF